MLSVPSGLDLVAVTYPATVSVRPPNTQGAWALTSANNCALAITGFRGLVRVYTARTDFVSTGGATFGYGPLAFVPNNGTVGTTGKTEYQFISNRKVNNMNTPTG